MSHSQPLIVNTDMGLIGPCTQIPIYHTTLANNNAIMHQIVLSIYHEKIFVEINVTEYDHFTAVFQQ